MSLCAPTRNFLNLRKMRILSLKRYMYRRGNKRHFDTAGFFGGRVCQFILLVSMIIDILCIKYQQG